MYTIKTIKDSPLGGFDTVVYEGDYETTRKAYIRLTRRYGRIFRWQFN